METLNLSCKTQIVLWGKEIGTNHETWNPILTIFQNENGNLDSYGKELAYFLKDLRPESYIGTFAHRVATDVFSFIKNNPKNCKAQITVSKMEKAYYLYYVLADKQYPIIELYIVCNGIMKSKEKIIFRGKPEEFIFQLERGLFKNYENKYFMGD